jgi:hypothetical protein
LAERLEDVVVDRPWFVVRAVFVGRHLTDGDDDLVGIDPELASHRLGKDDGVLHDHQSGVDPFTRQQEVGGTVIDKGPDPMAH